MFRNSQLNIVLCFTRLLCHADLSQPQLATLALNLWNLAQKHGFGNTKYTVSIGVFLIQNN